MKKPDYWLKAMDKSHPGKSFSGKVGVAWKNADGSISIDLEPFITLETVTRTPKELVLTLFARERTEKTS